MTSTAPLDAIRDVWTAGAADYDLDPGHGLLTPELQRIWSGVLTEVIGEAPLELLDVGTGTGILAVQAALLGHRVTGLDLTPAMLAHARARAESAAADVTWVEGDAMAIPLPDGSFDAVMSRHVLWTMTDPGQAFREWIRVTRSGGRVIWFDSTWPPDGREAKVRRWLAGRVQGLTGGVDPQSSHHYGPEIAAALPLRGLRSVGPVRELLETLGVRHPEIRGVRRLRDAELAGEPLYRRLQPRGRRYVGWFRVTPEVKAQNAVETLTS
jgi:ubiquinone/menaquinone biosynthesis C-methylase UbiE